MYAISLWTTVCETFMLEAYMYHNLQHKSRPLQRRAVRKVAECLPPHSRSITPIIPF